MIADMYLVETGEDILMDLERDVAASTAEHLDRFIFSEDVQVSNETDSLAQIGVYGPQSAAVVARAMALDRRHARARRPRRHGQLPPAVRRQRRRRDAA